MNKKRGLFLLVVGIVCILIVFVGTIGSKPKEAIVLDEEGEKIAVLTYTEEGIIYSCEERYESFTDVAVCEAITIIMEQEGIKETEAKKFLVQNEMYLNTTFRKEALDAIVLAYEKNKNIENTEFAAVLGGTDGKIYACYSMSLKENENMVLHPTYAASAIKPLSVYGQVIEAGELHWSDKVLDAPYISEQADGKNVEIPANATNCTYEETFMEDAVKKSLNTIPIRLLKTYGVEKSCDFLAENFEISLDREYRALKNSGEDEILANIALGYITAGISPKDLFAYYQIFANGGMYQPAYTITSIETEAGLYYEHINTSKRIFSEETAYIVNRLLKQVVTEDGTGADAQIADIDVCGKTGTSSEYEDNWFVGLTPQYIGAVWYGMEHGYAQRTANESVIVWKDIICQMKDVYGVSFEKPSQVVEAAYCKETGLLAGESCEQTGIGYYKTNELPKECMCD